MIAATSRTASLSKAIRRVSNAEGIIAKALKTKLSERTARIGATRGSLYIAAASGEIATKMPAKAEHTARFAQKIVLRSSWLTVLRCTIADWNPKSPNTFTKPVMTVAIPKSPKYSGASSRAMTIDKTNCIPWALYLEKALQRTAE